MNNKLLTLAVSGVVGLGLVSYGATQVSAYQGSTTAVGPNHTVEREAAMDKIVDSNDYAGWKKLMTEDGRNPGVLRKIETQAEFDKFAAAEKLTDAGKTAEAEVIRKELGLGVKMNNETGTGSQNGAGTRGGNGGNGGDGVCDNQ
jgi:hypothetical protein